MNEHFVLRIPDSIPLDHAAPLLCAGVTTWSPLAHWNVGPGSTVAIAGLGGLGHLALKLAKARGADRVIALTTTRDKCDELFAIGADDVLVMSDDKAIEENVASINFLLSTIPTPFDMNPYLSLLAHDGVLVSVGVLEPVHEGAIDFGAVAMRRLTIAGSLIGSLAATQEVLDFAAEHDISADVEVIRIQQINDAFDQVVAKDPRFRYVIDSSSLEQDRDNAAPLPV